MAGPNEGVAARITPRLAGMESVWDQCRWSGSRGPIRQLQHPLYAHARGKNIAALLPRTPQHQTSMSSTSGGILARLTHGTPLCITRNHAASQIPYPAPKCEKPQSDAMFYLAGRDFAGILPGTW